MPSGDSTMMRMTEVQSLAQDIFQIDTAIENEVANLRQLLSQRGASWQSESNEAYDLVNNKWQETMRQMNEVLQRAGICLGQSADTMQQTERSNTGLFAM